MPRKYKFLNDNNYQNKPLLPMNGLPILPNVPGKVFYDYEAQNNIYSLTAYSEDSNTILVLWHTDQEINQDKLLDQIHYVNDLTLKTYFSAKSKPNIIVRPMTANDIRSIFERPDDFVIGFNSDHYDTYITAMLLQSIYDNVYNQDIKDPLPSPTTVRKLSNWIIDPDKVVLQDHNLKDFKNQPMYKVMKNKDWNKCFGLIGNSIGWDTYPRLINSGLQLDMRLLNEKDKDTASLKTLAGQLGYQVEEPTGIDLSSDADLTPDQMITLLAYNVSDVLVTKLIFEDKAYKEKLKTRIQLLDRFDESNFHGYLGVNTTSAKFVEKVIAPDEKLQDDDQISFFYPVHGETVVDGQSYSIDDRQKEINQKYVNKTLTPAQRDQLDKQMTNWLRNQPGFGDTVNADGETIPRFRVKNGEIQEDLLELMRLRFDKFPKEVYDYYKLYRNAPSRENVVANYYAEHGESLPKYWHYMRTNKKTAPKGISVVLKVEGQPMVLTFSVGGVHGEVIDAEAYEKAVRDEKRINGLLDKYDGADPKTVWDEDESAREVITKTTKHFKRRVKVPNPKDYVVPVDLTDVIHVDVDSLYPSLMINLHMFAKWTDDYHGETFGQNGYQGHFKDVYAKLREERVAKKKFAESGGPNKSLWTPEQKEAWDIQLINKLLLNSASGIADGKWDTNVRMNNKASSMRIMGQLILTYLVFSVEKKGYYSVSTNTDGVYLTKAENPDVSEITDEIEEWKRHFHLGATPEIMKRFVSKDSNNRFEQQDLKDYGNPSGGTIGNAGGADPTHKMTQPFIVDWAIVEYFKREYGICDVTETEPDRELIKSLIQSRLDKVLNGKDYDSIKNDMLAFCWVVKPHKGTYLYLNTGNDFDYQHDYSHHGLILLDQVSRLVLTTTGAQLGAFKKASKPEKADSNLTDLAVDNGLAEYTGSAASAQETKVTNFNPDWHETMVGKDLSYYFDHPLWKSIDVDAYTNFAITRIVGDRKKNTIWLKPKF